MIYPRERFYVKYISHTTGGVRGNIIHHLARSHLLHSFLALITIPGKTCIPAPFPAALLADAVR